MQSRDVAGTGGGEGRASGGAGGPDERAPRPDDGAGVPMEDLVLRTPPNWTAVGFFALLGGMHLVLATWAYLGGRWEGYLSLMLGLAFVAVAAVAVGFRFELAVLPSVRRVRLRHGVGRFCFEQFVPFSAVRGVRLTFAGAGTVGAGTAGAAGVARRRPRPEQGRIELLCAYDSIECPPTSIPRQEALYLAIALNVPLTKVSPGPADGESADATEPIGRATRAAEVSSRREWLG